MSFQFKPNQKIGEFKLKNGIKILVRTPKKNDLKQLLQFINSLIQEDTFILETKKKTLKEEKNWLNDVLKKMKSGEKIYFVGEINNNIVAVSRIGIYSSRSRHIGEISFSVLRPYRNLGIGKILLKTLLIIGKKMKFKKLILGVLGNNKIAINLYKKFGFKEVTRVPKVIFYKGKYVDDVLMMKII